MSRVVVVLFAILAVAAASEWKDLVKANKKDELNMKISEVVTKCVEGSSWTSKSVKAELDKAIEEIPQEVACAVECFLKTGPQVMDSETGKLNVPDYFPEEVKGKIITCADYLEKLNIADSCQKALIFKKHCMKYFYEWQSRAAA